MPTRKPKRPSVQPVPNLHFVMIIIVAALTCVCVSAYGFVPPDRTGLYKDVVLILLGLLGGKLSNAFGKEPNYKPLSDVVEPHDEDGGEEREETNQ